MNDQKKHWNKLHAQNNVDHYSDNPTDFAEEVLSIIPTNSKILELGCGVGNDSVGFAKAGHSILATDFSDVAIKKNSERFKDIPNLKFEVLDLNKTIDLRKNEFDTVYARLSLHYFTDETTRKILREIHRVLKPRGYLCFICKSTNDPLYGQGKEIEKDMLELDGHIRHFFSEEYAKSLLDSSYNIEKIESGYEYFYERRSGFIKVIARAI